MSLQSSPSIQSRLSLSNACIVCGGTSIFPVVTIELVPVFANVLYHDRASALAAPRGDLVLQGCEECGHIFNAAFDPSLLAYSADYENSLHFSPHFQAYAANLARYLVDRYDLRGKHIIEIGSGKGDFLRQICALGGSTGAGYDPSYAPPAGMEEPGLTFINEYFSATSGDRPADLYLSRHTLEHLEQPRLFVEMLRVAMQHACNGCAPLLFFEVPNATFTIRDLSIWDLIYEHRSYFTSASLRRLLEISDFRVLAVNEAYDRQFLTIEATPSVMQAEPAQSDQSVRQLVAEARSFEARYQQKLARWQAQLAAARSASRHAVVWGAGSKGVSFLNFLGVHAEAGADDLIGAIIDINPRKHGMFVAGAGTQVAPPEFCRDYQPDTVFVMNPVYRAEIEASLEEMGLRPDLIIA